MRPRRLGQKCALATIVEARGSIPSCESAKLLVREDGSMAGTIGGGCAEAEVWIAAREVLEDGQPKRLSFNLGGDAAYDNGLICFGAGLGNRCRIHSPNSEPGGISHRLWPQKSEGQPPAQSLSKLVEEHRGAERGERAHSRLRVAELAIPGGCLLENREACSE